jgi:hypothetical protein
MWTPAVMLPPHVVCVCVVFFSTQAAFVYMVGALIGHAALVVLAIKDFSSIRFETTVVCMFLVCVIILSLHVRHYPPGRAHHFGSDVCVCV